MARSDTASLSTPSGNIFPPFKFVQSKPVHVGVHVCVCVCVCARDDGPCPDLKACVFLLLGSLQDWDTYVALLEQANDIDKNEDQEFTGVLLRLLTCVCTPVLVV